MTGQRAKSLALVASLLLGMAGVVGAEPPAGAAAAGKAEKPKAGPAGQLAGPARPAPEVAAWLQKAHAGTQAPEAVRMLIAIANGSPMGPGEGWFGPAQTRYTWDWLVRVHGKEAAQG